MISVLNNDKSEDMIVDDYDDQCENFCSDRIDRGSIEHIDVLFRDVNVTSEDYIVDLELVDRSYNSIDLLPTDIDIVSGVNISDMDDSVISRVSISDMGDSEIDMVLNQSNVLISINNCRLYSDCMIYLIIACIATTVFFITFYILFVQHSAYIREHGLDYPNTTENYIRDNITCDNITCDDATPTTLVGASKSFLNVF